jgi:hypothetical protein
MGSKLKSNLNWQQISAFRLARHNLLARKAGDPVAVSRAICGIQAQLMASAHMAVWARGHDLRPADITAALAKTRSLVKTLCMRRTLHLVPSDEFPLYISALKPSRMAALMRVMSRFGITQKDVDCLNGTVVDALSSGPMTRAELYALVRPRMNQKIKAWMERVASPFSPTLTEGLICYGPENGRETTFVRADQWLPRLETIPEQEAKRALFRGYLGAYGPATLQDVAYWSGMSMKEARQVLALLEGDLTEVQVVDKPALILSRDYEELIAGGPVKDSVRLLPGFDPYLLGHADKTPLVRPDDYKRVYRNQGWITPVVLVNGEVAAIWTSKRRGRFLSIEVEPLRKLPGRIRAQIEEEAASLGAFLECPVEVKTSE